MNTLETHIETLDPMVVAAVLAHGSAPEVEAWDRLMAYAEPRGLLEDPVRHPWFGFNNPPPHSEGDDYGYEMWIRVDTRHDPAEGVDIKEVVDGTYVVARCKLVDDPRGTIQEVWRLLAHQTKTAGHRLRPVHELERMVDPTAKIEDLFVDLMLPIETPEPA